MNAYASNGFGVIPFTTIVADPPWRYGTPGKIGASLEHRPNRDLSNVAGSAGSHSRYGSMSQQEIAGLNPPSSDKAHLYLWFTNRFAVEAHAIARAWGFNPITILTWGKVRHADGQPSMKMGRYFRGASEHVLFGVKGALPLTTKEAFPTLYLWPRLPHSEKPQAFYDLVEKVSPGPYLELFARKRRPGWIAWGDQVPSALSPKEPTDGR